MQNHNKEQLGRVLTILREKKNISQDKLADLMSLSKTTIWQWEKGKSAPSFDAFVFLSKFYNFDFINNDLIMAEKNLSVTEIQHSIKSSKSYDKAEKPNEKFIDLGNGFILMTIDLIEPYATASFINQYFEDVPTQDLPKHSIIVDREHKGEYKAFRVRGDSMDDGTIQSIPEGTIVTGRKIKKDLWTGKFYTHKWPNFVIITKDNIMVKEIKKHDVKNGIITLHSINTDKENYPDFDLHLDECLGIYNVVERSLR